MSSAATAGAADDSCARTGFEEPAARDASSAGTDVVGARRNAAGKGEERGWSTSRAPLSSSGANVLANKKVGGAFSGIGGAKGGGGGGGGGGPEMGRLWKGLCASGKQKSRR